MGELVHRLQKVLQRIQQVSSASRPVRLVAISKKKPVSDIVTLYEAGQRYFGENYAEELEKKSTDPLIREKCPEIRWHFVGHLQKKKVPRFLNRVENLDCIQTVDSVDLAQRLDQHLQSQARKVNVLLQINTSGEQQKSGVDPREFLSLYEFVRSKCPSLTCRGLMTIGSLTNVHQQNDDDFRLLITCRDELAEKFSLAKDQVELSMGMSHDFERAIRAGSSIVRVGSSIFGARS